MPQIATYPRVTGDWLKHETDTAISRDEITLAAGAGSLGTGAVLGKITGNGKYVMCDLGVDDGSQVPAAMLYKSRDVSGEIDIKAVAVVGFCEVVMAELTFHASFDTAEKKQTAMDVLGEKHIKSRIAL